MEEPSYLVIHEANPVILQVQGRASFDNCSGARDFFAHCQAEGHKEYVIDLKHCRGMDSTFLGILAGVANYVAPLGGHVTLTRPSESLLTVIHNLGLDKLLKIAPAFELDDKTQHTPLPSRQLGDLEQAKLVLQAHENLIAANPNTKPNFLDVVEFLKERIGSR